MPRITEMRPLRIRFTRLLALTALLVCSSAGSAPPAYQIALEADGSGEIMLDPARAEYNKNNIVVVTAIPAENWVFDHWEGDLIGTENPTTLRVSHDHTIVGVFTEPESPPPGEEPPPLPDSEMIVGYFAQWTIYKRGYLPKHIEISGAADAIDVINYAFAAPDADLRCASLDTYADYGKRFDASESVDGVADTTSQALKGNFNQLRKLKARHPHLRILLSLGGWTESFRFSDAALPQNREAFVASCIDMFVRGNLAPDISAAGVFDGLDIDWEYPGSCGDTCDFRADDKENFVALLAEFRTQLDAFEDEVERTTGTRPEYLLTIAAPAGAAQYEPIDLAAIHEHLDWINVMAYDFHGGWESSGPANHHAAVYQSPCDGDGSDWGDKGITAYLNADVPASKLLLGVPFYGRGWTGVSGGPTGDGLCESARGVPRGTYEKGVDDFKVLDAQGRPDYWDDSAIAHWTYDGREFWSYDDVVSIGLKADYVNTPSENPLRGMMFWELSGDTSDGKLVKAMRNGLTADAPEN
jgi:chitinase